MSYRNEFLVEAWRGLLYFDTPHFYQARFMNTISSSKETLELIAEYRTNPKLLTQLKHSSLELFELLQKDECTKKIDIRAHQLLLEYLPKIGKGDVQDDNLTNVQSLLIVLLDKEKYYTNELANRLFYLVTSDQIEGIESVDKERKRVLDLIYSTLNSWLSYLIFKGYSPTYLHMRTKALNKALDGEFSNKLRETLDRLLKDEVEYFILFSFSTHQAHRLKNITKHKSLMDIEMYSLDDRPAVFPEQAFINLATKDTGGFVVVKIHAVDYISAAFKAKNKLESLADWITFEAKSDTIIYSKICWVKHDTTSHPVQLGKLEDVIHRMFDYEPFSLEAIQRSYDLINIDTTRDRLRRVFKYYRLGITSGEFEAKCLNMWIALEALFEGLDGSTLTNITRILPKLYAYDSLLKRLIYFRKFVNKYNVEITPDSKANYGIDEYFFKQLNLSTLYEFISDNKKIDVAYDGLKNEYAKYLVCKIHFELETKDSILERLNKTERDVVWQINRMYYLRNKIVHDGYNGQVSSKIYSHISDYACFIVTKVLMSMVLNPNKRIRDVLIGLELGYMASLSKLKASNVVEIDLLYPIEPII